MRGPLILRPPRAATTMPTAAQTPRACAMCESYPASVAPERARCARATPRAWRQSDASRHLDTARQRDTTRPLETPLPPGHRASVRHQPPTGDAAATWTARASAMRAATWRRRCPLDTVRQRGASRAPDLRCPLPTWPAMATPCAQQSTAPPCCIHTTLSAPRGIKFTRRSRASYESEARHQASLASDWRA